VEIKLLIVDHFILHPRDGTETNSFYELVPCANGRPAARPVDRPQCEVNELVIESESYRKRQRLTITSRLSRETTLAPRKPTN